MREKIEMVIEEILRPLLATEGGDIALLVVDEANAVVEVQLLGGAAFHIVGGYLRDHLILPAIQKAAGQPVTLRLKEVPSITATTATATK